MPRLAAPSVGGRAAALAGAVGALLTPDVVAGAGLVAAVDDRSAAVSVSVGAAALTVAVIASPEPDITVGALCGGWSPPVDDVAAGNGDAPALSAGGVVIVPPLPPVADEPAIDCVRSPAGAEMAARTVTVGEAAGCSRGACCG
ncbi:hypothetical protein [Acidisoma sp.]|uniref:hypothetical protein n=1 Tax=Acidisoma sp. TaxID=1872115 RepID=UPI003B00079E